MGLWRGKKKTVVDDRLEVEASCGREQAGTAAQGEREPAAKTKYAGYKEFQLTTGKRPVYVTFASAQADESNLVFVVRLLRCSGRNLSTTKNPNLTSRSGHVVVLYSVGPNQHGNLLPQAILSNVRKTAGRCNI